MSDATQEVQGNDAADKANVDMKFEIVVIPVSNIDRPKDFYARLGWRLDADYDNGKDFRMVQFTPLGNQLDARRDHSAQHFRSAAWSAQQMLLLWRST